MNKENKIYGLRAIIEALNSDQAINKIYLQRGPKGDLFKELEGVARKKGVSTSYVPVEKLNRLSKSNHQGAVAEVSPVQFQEFESLVEQIHSLKKPALFLLLDGISDVRNFGAIIRTAECSGVDAIVIPKSGAAPINEDTVKTSAGAAFKVPIAKVDHLKDAVFYLQAMNIKSVAASEKSNKSIYDIDFSGPIAIVMGAEDKGISPSLVKIIDEQAKLPLMGDIGSLNVSVACGVFLYEVLRQRLG